jgi:hypothetical protein
MNSYLDYKDIIIQEGKKTYQNIVNTDIKNSFNKQTDFTKTFIGHPSKEWAEKNIEDLLFFHDKLSEEQMSLSARINDNRRGKIGDLILNTIQILERNLDSFSVFIDDGQWSLLNKLDTNYGNWIRMIECCDEKQWLTSKDVMGKILEFFSFDGVDDSLAIRQLFSESYDDYKEVRNSIGKTTNLGNLFEKQVENLLIEHGIPFKDFTEPGNRVDQLFGIDMFVELNRPTGRKWIPIQVKSNEKQAKSSFILNLGLNGLCIYPKKTTNGNFNFVYKHNKSIVEKPFEFYLKNHFS